MESRKRKESDLKQLEKKLTQATAQGLAQLKKLSAQEFVCEADAVATAEKFQRDLPWHREVRNVGYNISCNE